MSNNAILPKGQLTLQKFKKYYIELGNATEAYLKISPNIDRHSAAQIGHELLKKLDFTEVLEDMGITDKVLAQSIIVGMVKPTRKVEKRRISRRNEDEPGVWETITEYEDVPDYQTRHKYLETALKAKKKLKDIEVDIGEINFVWEAPPQGEVISTTTIDNPPGE